MTNESTVTRRSVLLSSAGAAGVLALTACSSSSSGGENGDASAQNPAPSGSTAAGGDVTSATPDGGDSSSSAPGGGGDTLTALDDVEVGSGKSVQLSDGSPAIVVRTAASTVVCFSAKCTHEGCTVKPEGAEFHCPCHQSRFNARTGAVLSGPAPSPLPKIPVTVQGGQVVTS